MFYQARARPVCSDGIDARCICTEGMIVKTVLWVPPGLRLCQDVFSQTRPTWSLIRPKTDVSRKGTGSSSDEVSSGSTSDEVNSSAAAQRSSKMEAILRSNTRAMPTSFCSSA